MIPKILFIPTCNSGTAYWRIWNPAVGIHRQGLAHVNVYNWKFDANDDINSWEKELTGGPQRAFFDYDMNIQAQMADAIVFQYVHTRAGLNKVRQIRDANLNKPIFCEIDDNLFNVPVYNPASEYLVQGRSMFREIVKAQLSEADGVFVSTPYMAEVVSEYNENVYLTPNAIDLEVWGKLQGKARPGIRIGWAGGFNHDDDLEPLLPIIKTITEKHKNVRFVFLGGCPKSFADVPGVESLRTWHRIDKYPKALAELDFDIGLASIQANKFNYAKSNLRMLEYSSLKIPTCVYIPTDSPGHTHFEQTINDGVDGLICRNTETLEKSLTKLITDRRERCAMGSRAFERIKKDFNLDTISREMMGVLTSAIESKRKEQDNDSCDSSEPLQSDGGRSESDPVQHSAV